jgi:uncharacterized membrane protein YidH (DUF202 family)
MNYKKKSALLIIICTILLLYLYYLSTDFKLINIPASTDHSSFTGILKYISIILCFIISLFIGSNYINTLDKHLLQTGLFFTVLADMCLIILNRYFGGILLFCTVQICYIIRFNRKHYKYCLGNLLIFLLLLLTLKISMELLGINIKALYIIAIFYGACIYTATFSSIKYSKDYPHTNKLLIKYGMILFVLCDINVAIYNITTQISNLNLTPIINLSYNLIWFFYLPSQLLLSLSGFNLDAKAYSKNN